MQTASDVIQEMAYEQGRAEAIDEYMRKAMTAFYDFDVEHGYPTYADVKDILCDIAEELKENTDGSSNDM